MTHPCIKIAPALLCLAATWSVSAQSLQGLYRYGAEEESFQPCGSRKVYWIKANKRQLAPLHKLVKSHRMPGHPGHPPIYVEVTGKLGPRLKKGWAVDYDGLLKLDRVERISQHPPISCAPG
ncbi:hypothetical protein KSF73_14080 [Burkholderiaceae bacterium DAT-1]|nr:hypothetical protein [Burkholderiaceae bacterium DAT-1]